MLFLLLLLLFKDLQERTQVGNSKNTDTLQGPPMIFSPMARLLSFFFVVAEKGLLSVTDSCGQTALVPERTGTWRHQQVGSWTQLRTFMCKSAAVIESDCARSGTKLWSRQKSISCTPTTKWANRTNAESPVAGIH